MGHEVNVVPAHGFQAFTLDGWPNVHIALLLVMPALHVCAMNTLAPSQLHQELMAGRINLATQSLPGCTREAPGKMRWASAAHCPSPQGTSGDMPLIFDASPSLPPSSCALGWLESASRPSRATGRNAACHCASLLFPHLPLGQVGWEIGTRRIVVPSGSV